MDNGSQDESCAFLREHYPETKIIQLDDNYGFSRAVNEGIRRSKEPYVILLNNDTEVFPDLSLIHIAGFHMKKHRKSMRRVISC